LFHRDLVVAAGSGALYLRGEPNSDAPVQLRAITDPHIYSERQPRARAVQRARAQLPGIGQGELLCDSTVGLASTDAAEERAWSDWQGARVSPGRISGGGYMAGAAWQCVCAVDAIARGRYPAANVSVAGTNQQSIAVRFEKPGHRQEKL
jgi:hypothetical protein